MYRIQFLGVNITKPTEDLEHAKEVKAELTKHFFTDCPEYPLVIVDDNNVPVD